jgi:hypothetical protein
MAALSNKDFTAQLVKHRHSTSLRFPFAYLANKRRKVVIRPDFGT